MDCMKNEVIHISAAEAADDFASLLDRVRGGVEIVIEEGSKAVAVVRPVVPQGGRLLSESIALAEAHEKDIGTNPAVTSYGPRCRPP